jgi:nucleoside-diphosphate-sugar epimerase
MLPAVGIYPITKLTCELLVNTYRELYGIDAAIVRPRSVYGPGRWSVHHPMPVPAVIQAVARGESVVKPTGSDTRFDLTYVKDEANGIIAALRHPERLANHVYNISFGRNVSMSEVFEVLRKERPKVKIEVGPGLWEGVLPTGRQRDASYHSSQRPPQDVSRAKADFGFEPVWPVERAIPDYLDWLAGDGYGPAR